MILRHHIADRDVKTSFEAEITIGKDSHQPAVILGDGDTGDFILAHHLERIGNLRVRRHCDGVNNHSALGPLDLIDFVGLLLNSEIAMDNADSALLGNRDGHMRLSDGVHGRAHDGNVELNIAGEMGLRAGRGRNDIGTGRQQ